MMKFHLHNSISESEKDKVQVEMLLNSISLAPCESIVEGLLWFPLNLFSPNRLAHCIDIIHIKLARYLTANLGL